MQHRTQKMRLDSLPRHSSSAIFVCVFNLGNIAANVDIDDVILCDAREVCHCIRYTNALCECDVDETAEPRNIKLKIEWIENKWTTVCQRNPKEGEEKIVCVYGAGAGQRISPDHLDMKRVWINIFPFPIYGSWYHNKKTAQIRLLRRGSTERWMRALNAGFNQSKVSTNINSFSSQVDSRSFGRPLFVALPITTKTRDIFDAGEIPENSQKNVRAKKR